jgi:hypothetical protein
MPGKQEERWSSDIQSLSYLDKVVKELKSTFLDPPSDMFDDISSKWSQDIENLRAVLLTVFETFLDGVCCFFCHEIEFSKGSPHLLTQSVIYIKEYLCGEYHQTGSTPVCVTTRNPSINLSSAGNLVIRGSTSSRILMSGRISIVVVSKCRQRSKTNKSNCQFSKNLTFDWLVDEVRIYWLETTVFTKT